MININGHAIIDFRLKLNMYILTNIIYSKVLSSRNFLLTYN